MPPTETLGAVDWDFSDANTGTLSHALHPYPAKFIPQLPRTLIEALSKPGETVLDPFVGSGTTSVEAITSSRHALGADVNPVAVMVTAAKTLRLQPDDREAIQHIVDSVKGWNSARSGVPTLFSSEVQEPDIPPDPAIEFWFDDTARTTLGVIRGAALATQNANARLLASVCLSAIAVAVSRQDSDTRYVRREKGIASSAIVQRFCGKLISALDMLDSLPATSTSSITWIGDARVLPLRSQSVDLVVTSPPYPNAYSYHLYHKTRLIWLGFQPEIVKNAEIGHHRAYSARNGADRATFVADMTGCLTELNRVVRPHGHACFVVGDSTIRGELIDNATLLTEVAHETGWKVVERFDRAIASSKKSFNPLIGKIKREHILILGRP